MAEKLSLGGRVYGPVGVGPLRQTLFVMAHARHAGLVGASLLDGETPEDFAARLLDMILVSGRALLLLGGLLLPDGKKPEDWTEEMAFETAGHLGGLMDPEEHKKVHAELLSMMLGFFVNGLGSWIASGRSSADASEGPSPKKNPSEGTENGPDSSALSPDTTQSEPSASSAGC